MSSTDVRARARLRGNELLLAEAVVSLAIARLAIVTIPFRRIAPRLGRAGVESGPEYVRADELERISWALWAAGSRLPWRCKCLEQGFAAKLMLRRRKVPHTLYLGARHAQVGLDTHAWVRSGVTAVTGGTGDGFAIVASYADL